MTHIETLSIHAGQHPDPVTGAVMTPHLSNVYLRTERRCRAQRF